jgi:hypothetical protein
MITNPAHINKIVAESFEKPKTVSVLMNTRKRFSELKESVDSLLSNAKNPESVEIVVRADDDDTDTLGRLNELPIKTLVGKRVGYGRAHESFMDMTQQSNGEFLLVWSDDFLMETRHWDAYFQEHRGDICIIYTNRELTSAIHRAIPLVWEKFGIWYCVDVIYKVIALELGVYVRHDGLVVNHKHRGTVRDYVESEIDYGWWKNTRELYEIADVIRQWTIPEKFSAHRPITDKSCNSWGSPILDRTGKAYWSPGGKYY